MADVPDSPWILDARRIKDETAEKIDNGILPEDSHAAHRLADMPDAELTRRLWWLFDTRDDLWDMFCNLENHIIDALIAKEED